MPPHHHLQHTTTTTKQSLFLYNKYVFFCNDFSCFHFTIVQISSSDNNNHSRICNIDRQRRRNRDQLVVTLKAKRIAFVMHVAVDFNLYKKCTTSPFQWAEVDSLYAFIAVYHPAILSEFVEGNSAIFRLQVENVSNKVSPQLNFANQRRLFLFSYNHLNSLSLSLWCHSNYYFDNVLTGGLVRCTYLCQY